MLSVQSALHSSWSSSLSEKHDLYDVVHSYDSTMLDFVEDVRGMFETPLETQNLVRLSRRLQEQFKQKLHSDPHCMLPSYNHALPDGNERGTFLALDVGGSNLRVALVELRGRSADDPMQISKMETWPIDNSVRALEGLAFFDWLAARIEHMLTQAGGLYGINPTPVAVGLAWSFPITWGFRTLASTFTDTFSAKLQSAAALYSEWERASRATAVF